MYSNEDEAIANINLKPEEEFISGLLWGLIKDNHLDEIQACLKDAETIVEDVVKVVKDVGEGSWTSAAGDVKDIAHMFPKMFLSSGDCSNMLKDVQAIEKWATRGWLVLAEDVAKDMLFHRKKIEADVHEIGNDWNAGEYYHSGMATADLLTVSLGPVYSTDYIITAAAVEVPVIIDTTEVLEDFVKQSLAEEVDYLLNDLLMLPELMAGFMYGMVGDNHLEEMKTCYASTHPLYDMLDAAFMSIEAWHFLTAIKELENFVYHFQEDVAPCKSMSEDIAAIELWAQAFKSPKTLAASVAKHYVLHKRAVTKDIAAVRTDWAAKSYFSTGKDAADLVTVLVGSIE